MVETCPDALITKDKWGETPLAYALLSEASLDVLNFLLKIHRAKWGHMPFDFGEMVHRLTVKKGSGLCAKHNSGSKDFLPKPGCRLANNC